MAEGTEPQTRDDGVHLRNTTPRQSRHTTGYVGHDSISVELPLEPAKLIQGGKKVSEEQLPLGVQGWGTDLAKAMRKRAGCRGIHAYRTLEVPAARYMQMS